MNKDLKINSVVFLNAKFREYCKLHDLDLSQVDPEKRDLFTSAWFAGFTDGFISGQHHNQQAARESLKSVD